MAWSAADPWAYTPPLSLWNLVEQVVSPGEQDEIKSMLGTSLVETTQDLHNEVKMLLEIWQDYKEEAESENSSWQPLVEPPHVRERLIQEICFLAESVREKSASKGVNPAVLLSRHNSQVLEYAEETKRCGSSLGSVRPQSARSSDGRQTPLMTSEHASNHVALDSSISEEVSSASGKLNYLQFDEVCNRLRETLTKEMEQLESDVAFLHSCLTDAPDNASFGSTPVLSREPTLTDLKEERSLLEKDLQSTEGLPNTPPVHKPPFLPATSASGAKMPSLNPISTKLKPANKTGATSLPNKNVPLKASHHVAQILSPSISSPGTGYNASQETRSSARTAATPQVHVHNTQGSSVADQLVSSSGGRGCPEVWEKEGKREGSAIHSRLRSAAHVKVVPVGSVHEPRVDSAGNRSLMPTPPPPVEDVSQVPRPNSAQRFRRMVMSYRDTT